MLLFIIDREFHQCDIWVWPTLDLLALFICVSWVRYVIRSALSSLGHTNHNCLLFHIYTGRTVLRLTLHYVLRISRPLTIWRVFPLPVLVEHNYKCFSFIIHDHFQYVLLLDLMQYFQWFQNIFYILCSTCSGFWWDVLCLCECTQVAMVSEPNCRINVSKCKCCVEHISVFHLMSWIITSHHT